MSKIEWTNKTWNPVTGCDKVSQGCKNCYAEKMHRRLMHIAPHKYTKPFLGNIELHDSELVKPLKIKKPTMFFVNSMSDLFHKDVPLEFIDKIFFIMERCPQHTFQILTKRPERAIEFFKAFFKNEVTLKNVWIGVSCEDQQTANERIPLLLQVPASIRFLSCEPLLEPIDIAFYLGSLTGLPLNRIHWVIVGGESGHNARPMHPNWVRSLRDQCENNNVPFFFKQWGEYIPHSEATEEQANKSKNRFFFLGHEGYAYFKLGKSKSGNFLDGKQHLNFPL